MDNNLKHIPADVAIKKLLEEFEQNKKRKFLSPPPQPKQSTAVVPKISEYAAAEAYNALHGAAPAAVEAERLKICGGCEFRLTTYKGATDPDNFGWCSKCGCGNNPRALLVTKAKLAQVSCPLTPPRWDKVEGIGGSMASVVDSVKGVAQSIKYLLTGNKDTTPPTN